MSGSREYVDVEGKQVDVVPTATRAVTILERRGEKVAALVHDPSLSDEPETIDLVASAVGLPLENERLQAELRSQFSYFVTLVNTAPSLFIHLDLEGTIVNQNAAGFVARSLRELAEQTDYLVGHLRANPTFPPPPDPRPAVRDRVFYAPSPLGPKAKVAFVYPGSGNQFDGMGRDLSAQWPEVLRRLNTYMSEGNNPDQPGRFVQWLYERTDVFTYPIAGIWYDIGSHETLSEANDLFSSLAKDAKKG